MIDVEGNFCYNSKCLRTVRKIYNSMLWTKQYLDEIIHYFQREPCLQNLKNNLQLGCVRSALTVWLEMEISI